MKDLEETDKAMIIYSIPLETPIDSTLDSNVDSTLDSTLETIPELITKPEEIILNGGGRGLASYFDTLVLSGGSSKGILTLGALQYMADNFISKNIINYVGTSSGAIICYLLIIGYTPIEIIVYICTHQLLEKLQHFNIVSMVNGNGASSFASIHEILEKMTISKISRLLTMKDIKEIYNKNLICMTYNLTTRSVEQLSPETHPDLPCLTALRMSSNLPLIFEKYQYNNNFYIDGGITDNFPIDIGDRIGNKVIGICLDLKDDSDSDENDILEYIYTLMSIPISQSINAKIKNASEKCKIVKLDFPKIKIISFNIESSTKLEMFSDGYQQMRAQL